MNKSDESIYLCKSECETNQFRLGDECVAKCPREYNYIGYNRICKENCNSDPNGQHYYQINEADDSTTGYYPIYECVNSCADTPTIFYPSSGYHRYYTEENPNKCLTSCPSTNVYKMSSEPYKCLAKCPDDFPFYNPSAYSIPYPCLNENPCTELQYFLGGNCLPECTVANNYISSNRRCLPKCPSNEIKKKKLNSGGIHQGIYWCLRICEEFTYQENIEDDPECMVDCPKNKRYIGKDNVCKTS